MADNTTGNGDALTNTTTSTSKGATSSASTSGDATSNVTTSNAGGGSSMDAGSINDLNTTDVALPFPHNTLSGIKGKSQSPSYKNKLGEIYKQHQKELESNKPNVYEPSDEMLAARQDAQTLLSAQIEASLRSQRNLRVNRNNQPKGNIKIRLTHNHIHAGVRYKAGDEIMVDEATADIIEKQKAGHKI